MENEEKKYIIREVCRALDLLEQFHDDINELGVTELSNRLNLSRNKVFRLLKTLESGRFIEQNKDTGDYQLGLNTFSLGQAYIKQTGLLRQAKPILKALSSECNETANLATLKDSHSVFLETVETDHTVRVIPRVGLLLPCYCTAAGKIQLAYMTGEKLDNYISNLELKRFTPTTITNKNILRNHLSKAAFLGYAVDNEELDNGVRCVSVPIRDYTSRIIGAISISGSSTRFTHNRIETELVPLLKKTGKELSAKLGYSRNPDANCPSCLTYNHCGKDLYTTGESTANKTFPTSEATHQLKSAFFYIPDRNKKFREIRKGS
jgi:IclR family transcriptional regulator, KDG regulon repressor